MTVETLKTIRAHMGVTQHEMANAMGVPRRTYEDLEGSRAAVRPVHLLAAFFGCIRLAALNPAGVDSLPDFVRAELDAMGTGRSPSLKRSSGPDVLKGKGPLDGTAI